MHAKERKEVLLREIDALPTSALEEVLDFVRFLKGKEAQAPVGTALLGEAALRKDWLRPEEDEAWQSL